MHNVTDIDFETAWADDNNKRIIMHVCSKYKKVLPDEELKFRGYMGLFNCLKKHHDLQGNKFTTSLHQHVRWECLKALRQQSRHFRFSPLFDIPICTTTTSPETIYVRDCLSLLPDEYRQIIQNYYFDRMTFREIGKVYGYTQVTAMHKLHEAKDAFRRLYQDD